MAQLTDHDLRDALREQVELLWDLCILYDDGAERISLPLSVTLRVLVHQGGSSHALLHQLGVLEGWAWLDSSPPPVAGNLLPSLGLVRVDVGDESSRYRPLSARTREGGTLGYDDPAMNATWTSFDSWWRRPVLVVPDHPPRSRKDVLLAMANKLGGAHIDPNPSTWARDLRSGRLLQFIGQDGQCISDPLSAAVRQIAQEVVQTVGVRMGGFEPPKQLRDLVVQAPST